MAITVTCIASRSSILTGNIDLSITIDKLRVFINETLFINKSLSIVGAYMSSLVIIMSRFSSA
jgi:hypothetical protein